MILEPLGGARFLHVAEHPEESLLGPRTPIETPVVMSKSEEESATVPIISDSETEPTTDDDMPIPEHPNVENRSQLVSLRLM
jgi:hypothetical protein